MNEDLLTILNQAIASITNWKTAGAIASIAILTSLLVKLSKTSIFQTMLGWLKLDGSTKRSWIAAGLGAIAAFFAAWGAGQPWPARLVALVTGALAGWSATGIHEAQTASDRALPAALVPLNATEVEKLKADIAAANALTDEVARLATKAALLDRLLKA